MPPGSADAPWCAATGRIQPRPRRNLPSSPSLSSFERLTCGMCWEFSSSLGEESHHGQGVPSGSSSIVRQDIRHQTMATQSRCERLCRDSLSTHWVLPASMQAERLGDLLGSRGWQAEPDMSTHVGSFLPSDPCPWSQWQLAPDMSTHTGNSLPTWYERTG